MHYYLMLVLRMAGDSSISKDWRLAISEITMLRNCASCDGRMFRTTGLRYMRRSRANEVLRKWGEAMERMWIGHTWDVMEKHYLMHLDEDFSTC